MPYIGNTIRAADDYRLIDDISSSFNGSTTSFALQVAGSAPVPFPKSPQQVLISVNGVIQEPDPTGVSGFNLVGTNIVFSSAPTNGHAFFGIIYATADYLNSGGNFPSGSTGSPSLTFIGDEDTGIYRKGSGSIGFVSNSTEIANTDSNGITISSGNLILGDSSGASSDRIKLGASGDLELFHGGSNSIIAETGTGNLELQTNSSIFLQKGTSEFLAKFISDGAVELYHDNTKRFETTNSGAKVSSGSTLTLEDSSGSVISFDESGTRKAFIGIRSFAAHDGNGIMIQTSETAPIKFAINNVVKAVLDNNGAFKPGADSTNDLGTSSVRWANVYADTLYGDGSNLTGISSDLVNDTSPQLGGDLDTNGNNIDFGDSSGANDDRAVFGADTDMQLYHTGSQGVLDNDTGALDINTTSDLRLNVQSIFKVLTKGGSENCIIGNTDGSVELYFNNVKKFETTTDGITVTGSVTSSAFGSLGNYSGLFGRIRVGADVYGNTIKVAGDNNMNIVAPSSVAFGIGSASDGSTAGTTIALVNSGGFRPASNASYDLGTSSFRWRNIYTNDLNLSNEGSSNDVDSTWGDYTIQEGFEDLYLINNRTGKKFKFNLTEVS